MPFYCANNAGVYANAGFATGVVHCIFKVEFSFCLSAGQGTVDPHVFDDIPPSTCKKGGALIRSGCDDDGYPVPKEDQKKKLSSEDHVRAVNKVPRHDYKGMDFGHMSQVLNRYTTQHYIIIIHKHLKERV